MELQPVSLAPSGSRSPWTSRRSSSLVKLRTLSLINSDPAHWAPTTAHPDGRRTFRLNDKAAKQEEDMPLKSCHDSPIATARAHSNRLWLLRAKGSKLRKYDVAPSAVKPKDFLREQTRPERPTCQVLSKCRLASHHFGASIARTAEWRLICSSQRSS